MYEANEIYLKENFPTLLLQRMRKYTKFFEKHYEISPMIIIRFIICELSK